MKTVQVTYKAKTDYVTQNQANIGQVMADLQQMAHPGLLYHACLGADGQTFTHTAFFISDDDEQVLLTLPSFKHFQEQLKAHGIETPPKQELMQLVGSSKSLF